LSPQPAARWERVQQLFHSVLDLPPAERAARRAAMEPGERAEVEALLAAHEAEGPLADRGDEALETRVPQRIGPFQLENLLGAGGMGAVYSALREGPDFSQRVALKLIRAGYADPRLEEQLKQERRILARLEHPGIARFVDGGTTETGQSWLAMEYVDGQPLTGYCRSRKVDTTGRLHLMLAVCDAIAHAHQRLVVHGDLKPSNILVSAEGRPRVLDFGIAELMEPSGAPARTSPTAPWMTPAYASPEQLSGRPPTTLSDVYALGVILYELLADGRPNPDLEPPSARVTAPRRRRELAGDLDAIALKALAREPGQRYASVEALADDIRRRLTGRPVRAHPDSLRYRVSRFTRRHRRAVGAAALLVLSLVLGIAAVSWQGAVARQERDRAQGALLQSEALSGFLIDLFQEADPRNIRGDTTVARALLQRGLSAIEGLDAQPLVQARLLDALGTIVVEWGQYDRGRGLLERGLALRRASLGPDHPDVALSLKHLGRALRAQAAYVQAESVYRAALAIERADGGADGDAEAETLTGLGFLMPYLARVQESEDFYREALAIRERVLEPGDPRLDASRLSVAAALYRKGDNPGAEARVREVLESAQARYGPDHPQTTDPAVRLADLLSERPDAAAEAESLYRRVITIRREAGAELRLTHPLGNLAALLGNQGRSAEAEALLRENLALVIRILGKGSSEEATSLSALAGEMQRQGRLSEAEELSRRSIDTWKLATAPDHPAVSVGLSALARIVEAQGRLPEAERIAREALELRHRTLAPTHSLVGLSLIQVGWLRMRQGGHLEAERLLQEAVGILEPQTAPTHSDIRSAYRVLSEIFDSLGRSADAARYRALAASAGPGG
jgi:serine/threonine-protein kinase